MFKSHVGFAYLQVDVHYGKVLFRVFEQEINERRPFRNLVDVGVVVGRADHLRPVHLDEVGTFEAVRKPRLKDHLLDGIAANFSHLLQHVAELVTKRECFFIGKPEAISEYCT